jgi:hypothetical protein
MTLSYSAQGEKDCLAALFLSEGQTKYLDKKAVWVKKW